MKPIEIAPSLSASSGILNCTAVTLVAFNIVQNVANLNVNDAIEEFQQVHTFNSTVQHVNSTVPAKNYGTKVNSNSSVESIDGYQASKICRTITKKKNERPLIFFLETECRTPIGMCAHWYV